MVNTLINKLTSDKLLKLILLGIVSGSVWFILLYNPQTLPLTNIDWIYAKGGDLFQHQIGWEFFRQEPWRFPLGHIEAYGYPFGNNVSYTDSIPLFAYFSKLILGQNGPTIQYLGVWELFSLILQMILGMLILREFTSSISLMLLGASLLVLSPMLLYRAFEHNSLTAQWILLAGIWFVIRSYRCWLWRGAWILLFVVALLVHLYFVAMLIPLWAVSLYFRTRRSPRQGVNIRKLAIEVAETGFVLGLLAYAMGLFSLSVGNLLAGGFGLFSWNLNGLVNPLKYSRLFMALPLGSEGQYEGFSYLGLGNLITLAAGLIIFALKERSRRALWFIAMLVIISIPYILFSLSSQAWLGDHLLWDISLSKKLQNAAAFFRASGRFIWPVFYFIVLFSILSLVRKFRLAWMVLLLALVVQFFDIQPLGAEKKAVYTEGYQSPLQSEFWAEAAEENQHLMLLPASKAHAVFLPFAIYARQNRMTLNWGYFSRANLGGMREYGEQAWAQLLAGMAEKGTIYVLWEPELRQAVGDLPDSYYVGEVEGFTVVIP